MLQQQILQPESVKSMNIKDISKISKNDPSLQSQTDKIFNNKDFKFTDMDSVQEEHHIYQPQQQPPPGSGPQVQANTKNKQAATFTGLANIAGGIHN